MSSDERLDGDTEDHSFVCPKCGAESWHPKDIEFGYCGACHGYTGTELPSPGTEDWTEFAHLHNTIAAWPRPYADRRLLFSERDSLAKWLWSQGYRKEPRDHGAS